MIEILKEIIDIDSPSGYTDNVVDHIISMLPDNFIKEKTNKGALFVSSVKEPECVITAHIDTLGAMVSGINDDGTLRATQIGGWPVNSFEGEYCTVLTSNSKKHRGTFLLNNPAAHVNREVGSTARKMEKMHIRIDLKTSSVSDTRKAGIDIGDFIFFDPRFEYTSSGFIKSRFMDDKAGAAVMIDILLNHSSAIAGKPVGFFFSNFEEVGHGARAGIPPTVKEMLVIDMGVVGNNVEGKEHSVSICAKDSSGPYDYTITNKLTALAKDNKLNYKRDVFPYYGSDGSAALMAGYNLRIGLIGPGVSASHGVERTHIDGLKNTEKLVLSYIDSL